MAGFAPTDPMRSLDMISGAAVRKKTVNHTQCAFHTCLALYDDFLLTASEICGGSAVAYDVCGIVAGASTYSFFHKILNCLNHSNDLKSLSSFTSLVSNALRYPTKNTPLYQQPLK